MCWPSEQPESMSLVGRKMTHAIEPANEHAEEAERFLDRETLLREMQHRVANSLQIVQASSH